MEGTPFVVESNNEDDQEKHRKEEEERASKAKKPEVFGILAVESPAEDEPTPFEKAWEATRKPDAETEEQPPAEAVEAEMPVERVPEERARAIVQEMVAPKQEIEAEEPEIPEVPEAEPEPEAETEPKPEAEVKAEEEPVEIPEAPKVEAPEPVVIPEAAPAEIPDVPEEKPEPEPVETIESASEPEAEVESEPVTETESEPEPEVEKPEPTVEAPEPEPETPPNEDDKKPGFIRSLFSRGDRKKTEEEPKPEPEAVEEKAPQPEPAAVEAEPEPIAEDEPEEPKFEFKEKTEEDIEKPKVEEAPEELPEAEPEHKPEAKPERIGHMLLNTEATPVEQSVKPASEASVSSQEAEKKLKVEAASPIEPVSGKRIETLSRTELMQLGEKIEINGNNLRHIYETHLIGERGLRRLVAEHLRGGDLSKALRREVMEHEMDFERDPVMRNLVPTAVDPIDSNKAVLETLLEKADVSLADVDNPTVGFKAPSSQKKAGRRQSHRYRSLDIVLVVTISSLCLLIILVLLIKG